MIGKNSEDEIKIRLKHQDLGSWVLQFAHSDLEGFKVLQTNKRLWKGIPLDYSEWRE